LNRATKLITGLSQEKISWSKKVDDYYADLKMMPGDIVLCSGIITYLGAFNIRYR
jgi:dynein heavy chain